MSTAARVQESLRTLISPKTLPALFVAYTGPDNRRELPLVVQEPQNVGDVQDYHQVQNMIVQQAVAAAVLRADVELLHDLTPEERFNMPMRRPISDKVGKHGMKQDGSYGNRLERKKKGVRITRSLFRRYNAVGPLAFLETCRTSHRVHNNKNVLLNEHDACDAFLLVLAALEAMYEVFTPAEKANLSHERPLIFAGIDPGSRNFALCLLALEGMRARAPYPDGTARAPDPLIRILHWAYYDLLDNVPHVMLVPEDVLYVPQRDEESDDESVAIQSERKAAAKKRAAERAKERRQEKKRKRETDEPPAPRKRAKKHLVVIDLVNDE